MADLDQGSGWAGLTNRSGPPTTDVGVVTACGHGESESGSAPPAARSGPAGCWKFRVQALSDVNQNPPPLSIGLAVTADTNSGGIRIT
jgi:hypothetical protein